MTNSATNEALQAMRKEVISNGYASGTSCYVASARGALIQDVEGKEYIDFAGGNAVMNMHWRRKSHRWVSRLK